MIYLLNNFIALEALLAMRRICNPEIVCSIQTESTKFYSLIAQSVEQQTVNLLVRGSNPRRGANINTLMKPLSIPIKVETLVPMNYKFIEWKIHNVCNHDCVFCAPQTKDGTQPWFDIETYKRYVDKLASLKKEQPMWIQITGGEPTLFPELLELLQYIQTKGIYVSLISNGVRTLRWWNEVKEANVLNSLFLTFHCDQTRDYAHIAEVANLFHDKPVSVSCWITHTEKTIDFSYEAFEYLRKNTGALILIKAMFIGSYDIYKIYTKEQLARLKGAFCRGERPNKVKTLVPKEYDFDHRLKVKYDDGTSTVTWPQEIMKNQKNNFYGWDCNIGQDTMRIDYNNISRGVCMVGGTRDLSEDNLFFSKDSIQCDVHTCMCSIDIIATKELTKNTN